MKEKNWKLFLADWETQTYINFQGNKNDNITQNLLDEQSTPPKLILRNNISIESKNINLLKFIQRLIEFYEPKNWSEIEAIITVPKTNEVSNFINSDYPSRIQILANAIKSAWKEEDKLENLIQNLYGITLSEKKFIDDMMEKWIRK